METKTHRLRIKIISLAEEARAIRRDEVRNREIARKPRANTAIARARREDLYRHRMDVVRPAARIAQLAYGYLRGKRYREIEPTNRALNSVYFRDEVGKLEQEVARFGGDPSGVLAWLKEPAGLKSAA